MRPYQCCELFFKDDLFATNDYGPKSKFVQNIEVEKHASPQGEDEFSASEAIRGGLLKSCLRKQASQAKQNSELVGKCGCGGMIPENVNRAQPARRSVKLQGYELSDHDTHSHKPLRDPVDNFDARGNTSRQEKREREFKWPNEHLGARYNNFGKSVMPYKQLDLRLLVAGELNIALGGRITGQEQQARLQLLEDVVFDSAYYQWPAILRFHAAVLSQVQAGELAWGQSYARLQQQMLMPFSLSKGNSKGEKKPESGGAKSKNKAASRDDKVYYCADFQGGACSQTGHHTGQLFGNSVKLHHVCSACLKHDSRRANHPASSVDCPHHDD